MPRLRRQNPRDTKAERKRLKARRAIRAIERAGIRWDGAMLILKLCRRAVPQLNATGSGGFALQQKYGI